jgi:tetratricopeptide (TPR) repeat protein
VELPETLESIWKRRIDHVLARLTASAEERAHLTELLQVAAALGQHVNTRELREAALEAGIWEPNQLQDGLIDAGLARPTPDGWRFDHRLLWEAISTWASKDGNWTRWLSACASALADRAEHDRSGRTAWRMAQYLLEAGEREAALEPLQLAVRRFRHIGHERWGDVVTRRAEVIDELGLGVDDRRVVQSLIEQAMKAERDNRLDDTASIRDRAEQSARTNGFDVELARVLQDRATLARREGEIQKALDYLDEARELLDPEKHPEAHARATGNTATTLIQCARPGEARVLLEDVLEAARHNGLVTVELRSLVTIGWTWMEQGEAERAAEYGHLAYDKSTDYGHRTAEGSACVLLSDAYRELEDFACSREWSERALALFQSRGVETSAAVVELNLLMTDLMSGDFERARQSLPRLRDKVEQIGSSARQRFILACEMVLAAEAGEREAFAHALDALEGQLASSSTLMRDIPVMVELAADMARGTDFGKPAEDAVELVERLWREYSGDADATSVDSTREDG